MANENTFLKPVMSGICIVVVAALIIWSGASVQGALVRLSVLETQFAAINSALVEIKADSKANRQMLMEIRGKLP